MFTQVITNALYAAIAAGMLFQIVTVVRLARKHRAGRVRARHTVRPKTPSQPVRLKRRRRRDYRVALRVARASVCA